MTAPLLWAVMLWADRFSEHEHEGWVLRLLKAVSGRAIRFSLRIPLVVLGVAFGAVAVAAVAILWLESDFLPPFNEGSVQINVVLPPGTSLATSSQIAARVEERLQQIEDIMALVRKTGRAELDEHAVPVSQSEIVASLNPNSAASREEILDNIREALADIPGIVTSVEQPLAHLISAMLSGVQAQVAIKLYGDDLEILRRKAQE